MARITVVDAAAVPNTAAERLATLIEAAVTERGRADVSLTGGSTPRALYEVLAQPERLWRSRIDWSRVHLFWGDERHVPPDHQDSNFRMADRALVQHVPIPAGQVHRIRAEHADPHQAAAEYAAILPETFDVMLLGLGEDCHIASIFPGSPLLDRDGPPVVALSTPKGWRITLTPRAILASRAILMLVAGENKADAVALAIEAPLDVHAYPGQLIREAGERVEWMMDTAAAGRLRRA